jgi:iron complex outermembrane receptor protein
LIRLCATALNFWPQQKAAYYCNRYQLAYAATVTDGENTGQKSNKTSALGAGVLTSGRACVYGIGYKNSRLLRGVATAKSAKTALRGSAKTFLGGIMKGYLLASGVSLVSALMIGQVARAQTAGTETGAGQLEEVVVTAEKREESAQKTPISMEVYTAQDLAQHDIVDMQSLANVDTSLNYTSGSGEGFLTLRGVSSSDTTEIGSPSVPVVVDDFSSNRSWSMQTSMFDLARVEVLRGPQGTLYGHSATGGIVNVVSQAPTNQFAAGGSVEVGNYSAVNSTGYLNIPFSDFLAIRAAVSDRKHDGYHGVVIDDQDAPRGIHGDDEDSRGARLSALFTPTTDFRALLSFTRIEVSGVGEGVQSIPFIENPAIPGDIYHTKPALGNPESFPIYGLPFVDAKSDIMRWNLAQSNLPGNLTLSYLGGYGFEDWNKEGSGSTTLGFLANPALGGGPYLPTRQYNQDEEPHTQTHELRVNSSSDSAFTYQGGLYYFEERNDLFSHTVYGGTPVPSTELFFQFPEVRQTDKAVYAQASYAFDPANKVTAGARYSKDDVQRTGIFDLIFAGNTIIPETGYASSNRITWHGGYDLSLTDANLLYAKADSGYKPGGFSTCAPYAPEDVTTGEVGSKNRFENGRIQWNAAVFYDDYRNQQVAQFTASCPSGTQVTNAGSSRIYGVETDFTALAGDLGKVDFDLSYIHATFTSFLIPPTIGAAALPDCARTVTTTAGSNCDLSGNTLPRAPRLTVAAAYEYDWHLASEASLNLRLEGKYTTKQYFDSFNFQDTEQGSFGVLNAYLNYVSPRYTVGVWIRNIANENYLTDAAEATGGNSTEYQYTWAAPRTYGGRLEVRL